MTQRMKSVTTAIIACVVGAAGMRYYDHRQFKQIAYGSQLRYGIVDPVSAVNHLVVSGNQREQQAAAVYLIQHRNHATADTLARALPYAAPTARPFIEVGLGKFFLSNYQTAPEAYVRTAALGASRYWRSENKVSQVAAFLSDADPNVVGQAVYELGEIGDPSVLPQLMAPTFDKTPFITEVRKKLSEEVSRKARPDDGV